MGSGRLGLTAFLLLPCFVGVLAGTSVTPTPGSPQRGQRFSRAFLITSITVVCYTLVGLVLTRTKMQSSDKSMDFVIFIVVPTVYGAMAGLVSGVAGSSIRSSRRRHEHLPP